LEKLHRWEFADLAELRPLRANEMLNPEPDPQRFIILPGLEVARPKKKQVTDIISWSQCFLVYMAVMHKKFPDKVPNMIAYMLTIVRAQQEFEDPGWRIYDHNYRLKAAASGNQNWAELDPHLYSQCFTGRAKKVPSCAKCNSFRHAQEDCPHGCLWPLKGDKFLSRLHRQRVRPTDRGQPDPDWGEKSGVAFALHLTGRVHAPTTLVSLGICVQGALAATRPPSAGEVEKVVRRLGAQPRIGGEGPKVTGLELCS